MRRAMSSLLAGSCWRRCGAIVCSARLSWRSPPRLSRCRCLCPLEAGTGATPARRAKQASERSRPWCDQATISWAATAGPTPGSSSRAGASARTWPGSSRSSSSASMVADSERGRPRSCRSPRAPRPAAPVPCGEPEQVPIAAPVRARGLAGNDCPGRRCHDRHNVLVAVRVDAEHVVHLVCKHPTRSSDLVPSVRWCRSDAGKPRRQDCDESRRDGGQAPDQAKSGRQTGAATHEAASHPTKVVVERSVAE
jgi:hypothetical protein